MRHFDLDTKEDAVQAKAHAQDLEDLKIILGNPSGMRFFARLLLRLGVGSSQWGEGISIYRNVALRDAAEDILQDIAEADETLFNDLQSKMRILRSYEDA